MEEAKYISTLPKDLGAASWKNLTVISEILQTFLLKKSNSSYTHTRLFKYKIYIYKYFK